MMPATLESIIPRKCRYLKLSGGGNLCNQIQVIINPLGPNGSGAELGATAHALAEVAEVLSHFFTGSYLPLETGRSLELPQSGFQTLWPYRQRARIHAGQKCFRSLEDEGISQGAPGKHDTVASGFSKNGESILRGKQIAGHYHFYPFLTIICICPHAGNYGDTKASG